MSGKAHIIQYKPSDSLQGYKAGNYAFNHFEALYGPAIGLYGVLKNVAEENLTRNKNENPEREGIKGLDSISRHLGKRTEKGKGNQSRQNLIGFKGIQVSDNF